MDPTLRRRALLALSLVCSAPTLVTVGLIGMNLLGWLSAIVLALGFGAGAAEGGGLIMAVFSVASFATSAPISLCSVVSHVIGGLAAFAVHRDGPSTVAVGLMVLHAVTFVAGAAVALFWLATFLST